MSTSVTVSAFYTRNLGNFENAKVGYEIESDERRPDETVDEFKDRLQAKVDKWLEDRVNQIDAEAAQRG